MDWPEILKYEITIRKIASKFSSDPSLAEDVAGEVMLKLFEDKNLDTSKFDPAKKDAAIRNTIRNKTLKVLRSKKIGRWQFDSLEQLNSLGFQIDEDGNGCYSGGSRVLRPDMDGYYPDNFVRGDTDFPYEEDYNG